MADQSQPDRQNATDEAADSKPPKRPLSEPTDDTNAKRLNYNTNAPEEEELDLDALMAQLQQHTDKATPSKSPQLEPEMSIEQQLKGALSSLELETGDLDLDQISQLLKGDNKETKKPNPTRTESLIQQMPPPPVMHGKLPPMPPPPPAFTSPIASSFPAPSAQQNKYDIEPGSSNTVKQPLPKTHTQSDQQPPPTLSNDYQQRLMNQMQDANENENTPQYLNENQSILSARRKSILLLDSLAYQVLEILSCSHYQETLATVTQPGSERGMIFRIVLDTFEDLKRIYMKWETPSSSKQPQQKLDESRPFLPYAIPGVEQTRENLMTIQRVNVATFVAALFGSIEIGFWELDEWFIKVFVPETGRMLKQQANIYLDLKTQAYISAVEASSNEEEHKRALEHLFPTNLEKKMQYMLGVRSHLTPQEKDFVARCHRRRDNIMSESVEELPKKYHWVPFLREVSDYISKNHNTLLPPRKQTVLLPEPEGPERVQVTQTKYPTRRQAPASYARAASAIASSDKNDVSIVGVKSTDAPAAKIEIQENGEKQNDKEDKPNLPVEGHPMFPPLPKQVLPPPGLRSESTTHQIAPPPPQPTQNTPEIKNSPVALAVAQAGTTLAAYEAAKASAEGTDAMRPKSSMFTTRRTWTKQEEEALLKGMDKVQGPYWSQILELYGPGGKISEVLKDRTQVQLKDKARNLKMFFVRLGLPIPAVFQYVTGDYETRKSSGRKLNRRTPMVQPHEQQQQSQSMHQPMAHQMAHHQMQPPQPHSDIQLLKAELANMPPPAGTQQHVTPQTPQPGPSVPQPEQSQTGNTNKQNETNNQQGNGSHNPDDQHNDLADVLDNDKDDLNTLLDRVGKFVENH